MNHMLSLTYLTSVGLPGIGTAQPAAVRNSSFGRMAAQLRAERAGTAGTASETADLGMAAYQQSVRQKISALPLSLSSQMQSISVQITDEGFAAMKNDPEYEAWVLDTLAQDFRFQNPWTAMCGGGYAVHRFGAAKEQYHGESWYPGYMGGEGAALFDRKSEGSFWEQRLESHKKFMELQREAAARRRRMMKLRMNGGGISAAELLMGLL